MPGPMRRTATMLLPLAVIGALSACKPETPGPAAYVPSDEDADLLDPFVAEPEWSAEEMGAAMDALLVLGFPNPKAPYIAYLALLEHRDEACPGEGDQLIGQEMAQGGCTAASGVHYEGNTTLIETDEADEGGERRGFQLGGDFQIEDAEGYRLAGGGGMSYQISRGADGLTTWVGEAAGTWIHTRRDDWLGKGISATLNFSGAEGGADDYLYLDGTVGIDGTYVQFVELSWPDGCGGYPTGSLRVRDPSGVWTTLDLADRCDGCGAWSADGADLGEACVDLRPYGAAITELGTW